MTNKTRVFAQFFLVVSVLGLAIFTAPNLANAALNVNIQWVQTDDSQENPCMRPTQAPLQDGVVTFKAQVTNNDSQPIQIDHAAFHDPVSGCGPTVHTPRTDTFSMSGTTYYSPGQSGTVTFNFDVNKFNCGRVQIDAGYHNPNIAYDSTVFLGEVIDYGVDCSSNPPPAPGSCIEAAALTAPRVIPATVTAGQSVPFQVLVYNSGDTNFYHGMYFRLMQTTNLNISPSYGHMAFLQPTQEQLHDFTLTAPATPGTYSITFQMVHLAGADYQNASGQICAPAPANDVYFGNQLTMTFTVLANQPVQETGTVIVASNVFTKWTLIGPENYENLGGVYGSYTTAVGTYSVINVPTNVTDNGIDYVLSSVTPSSHNLTANATVAFQITYTENKTSSLNAPVIIQVSNAKCSELKLTWEDKSDNEDGFHLYRADNLNNNDYQQYMKIASVGANVTTYIDKPAINKSYYYIVAAYTNNPAAIAPSQSFYSDFNRACTSDIQGTISITAVNSNPNYDFNQIKDNDTVTLQIMLDNLGPAEAYITKITNNMSGVLNSPRNLTVTGLNSSVGSPAISGSYPNYTFNVSGKKDVGGLKWIIKFDATVSMNGVDTMGQFTNCSTIHYFDDAGTKTEQVCLNQILTKTSVTPGLRFQEVAP